MKRNSKRGRESVLLEPITHSNDGKKGTIIPNSYVEELKLLYRNSEVEGTNINTLFNLFEGGNLHFFIELWDKLTPEDLKQFICSLLLVEKQEKTFLVQKGRKTDSLHVLIDGEVHYGVKTDNEEQHIFVGHSAPGFAIYPQLYMTPRYANLSVICHTDCSFLAIKDQTYNKFLKKIMVREMDVLTHFLMELPIFSGISILHMRKYCGYFLERAYKYNETIYSIGESSEQMFIILKGQVELSAKKGTTQMSLVNLSEGECFGLTFDLFRKNTAKSKYSNLRVLVLNRYIMDLIKGENTCVANNCLGYQKGTDKLYHQLLTRNMAAKSKSPACQKLKKKKKKKGMKSETSLVWWGLAHKIKTQHRYMLMNPHQAKQYQEKANSYNGKSQKSLISHKIAQLKKKVEQEDNSSSEEEKENSPWKSNSYIPKIKAKVRLLEVKPKAIDMAQNVKKKLVTYAKNMSNFCEKLDLQ